MEEDKLNIHKNDRERESWGRAGQTHRKRKAIERKERTLDTQKKNKSNTFSQSFYYEVEDCIQET